MFRFFSKENIVSKIKKIVFGKTVIDAIFLEMLEEVLLTSDVGMNTTEKIIKKIEQRAAKDTYMNEEQLFSFIKEEIMIFFEGAESFVASGFSIPNDKKPYIIMVVGVNGVGKTTTIGKLAYQYKQKGYSVLLGAGDTFRAAAVEQLKIWGERIGVPVVEQGMNTPPSSVAFETVKKAVEMKADVAIIDTAGRLQNKINLMNELSKIKKVMQKFLPDAPHEVLLVLDGSTGQNAFSQTQEFMQAVDVNSIAITKLDGSAKGGVIIGISDQFHIPIKYIGVGEQMTDLEIFDSTRFVDALFSSVQG
ncbi:MAG: signal recognition particle-docking protein FtsY [Chitinophagaceae bacterium]|nr:signal recognition particle-docking protein FtsY [Chitinophagaceae bacterium]